MLANHSPIRRHRCVKVRTISNSYDLIVIGAGPSGAAAALRAARGGARVAVFEKASQGRDKACGDGLTPRAITALDALGISIDGAHRIDGLRMIAGNVRRELLWPQEGRFAPYGAVWPRRHLDRHLVEAAMDAGAEIIWNAEALPLFDDDGNVAGVTTRSASSEVAVGGSGTGHTFTAPMVALATGATGAAARMLGAVRVAEEPFGLAIRTYAETPRHGERHMEACLTLRDSHGTWIPGYGWMFPAGDGTVNMGVGVLSTMRGFSKLNFNNLLDTYRDIVTPDWEIGEYLERPRAWRLPMSAVKRHGPRWAAIGDAAGLINPMNGEGIDYGLESGMLLADLFLDDASSAPGRYDELIAQRFDAFLRFGRRFCFLIAHPRLLRNGLRLAVGSQAIAELTLEVIGNLIDDESKGTASRVLKVADRGLAWAEPLLRRGQRSEVTGEKPVAATAAGTASRQEVMAR